MKIVNEYNFIVHISDSELCIVVEKVKVATGPKQEMNNLYTEISKTYFWNNLE